MIVIHQACSVSAESFEVPEIVFGMADRIWPFPLDWPSIVSVEMEVIAPRQIELMFAQNVVELEMPVSEVISYVLVVFSGIRIPDSQGSDEISVEENGIEINLIPFSW